MGDGNGDHGRVRSLADGAPSISLGTIGQRTHRKRRRANSGSDSDDDDNAFKTVVVSADAPNHFLLAALYGGGPTGVVPLALDGTKPENFADVVAGVDETIGGWRARGEWTPAKAVTLDASAGVSYRPKGTPEACVEAFLIPVRMAREATRQSRQSTGVQLAYQRREVWVTVSRTSLEATLRRYESDEAHRPACSRAFRNRARPVQRVGHEPKKKTRARDQVLEVPVVMTCTKLITGLGEDIDPAPYRIHHTLSDTVVPLCCRREGEVPLLDLEAAVRAYSSIAHAADEQARRDDNNTLDDSASHMVLVAHTRSGGGETAAASLLGPDDDPVAALANLCQRMNDGASARGIIASYFPLGIEDPPRMYPTLDEAFSGQDGVEEPGVVLSYAAVIELTSVDVRRLLNIYSKDAGGGGGGGGKSYGKKGEGDRGGAASEFDGVSIALHEGGVVVWREGRECVLSVRPCAPGAVPVASEARVAALRESCSGVEVALDATFMVSTRTAPGSGDLGAQVAHGVIPPRLVAPMSSNQGGTITMLLALRGGSVVRVAVVEVHSPTHTSTMACMARLDEDFSAFAVA